MSRAIVLALALLVAARGQAAAGAAQPCPSLLAADPVSDKGEWLLLGRAAYAAASLDDQAKLAALGTQLRDEAYLAKIDVYRPAAWCIYQPVLALLAKNPNPEAGKVLTSLMTAKAWKDRDRGEALLRTSVVLRKPSAKVIALWKTYSKPKDDSIELTVDVLLDNGSPEALKLFAKLLVTKAHDLDSRVRWVNNVYAQHRNQPSVIAMATKLLAGKLPRELREAFIEASINPAVGGSSRSVKRPELTSYDQATRDALVKLIAAARAGEIGDHLEHLLDDTLLTLKN